MITAEMNFGRSAIGLQIEIDVATYNQDVPIERCRVQILRRLWEEVHHKTQDQEAHADNVEWKSPDSQTPWPWKQRLPNEAFPYDATDRNDVRTGKRTGAERCDDVESYFAAQIDQREQHGETVSHVDCVHWEIVAGTNAR